MKAAGDRGQGQDREALDRVRRLLCSQISIAVINGGRAPGGPAGRGSEVVCKVI